MHDGRFSAITGKGGTNVAACIVREDARWARLRARDLPRPLVSGIGVARTGAETPRVPWFVPQSLFELQMQLCIRSVPELLDCSVFHAVEARCTVIQIRQDGKRQRQYDSIGNVGEFGCPLLQTKCVGSIGVPGDSCQRSPSLNTAGWQCGSYRPRQLLVSTYHVVPQIRAVEIRKVSRNGCERE